MWCQMTNTFSLLSKCQAEIHWLLAVGNLTPVLLLCDVLLRAASRGYLRDANFSASVLHSLEGYHSHSDKSLQKRPKGFLELACAKVALDPLHLKRTVRKQ